MTDDKPAISKKERDGRIRKWLASKRQVFNDEVSMKVAAHYVPHWMEVCGVDDPNDIDYSRTDVSLEYFLCNAQVIRDLTHGKRYKVMPMLSEAERDLYLNGKDSAGHYYTEIEKYDFDKELTRANKNRKKAQGR